jgi:hypothetical protein
MKLNGTRADVTFDYLEIIPKEIPAGKILAHNHIPHSPTTWIGTNGFRAWFADNPPDGFELCPCGWSGLQHFAAADHVEIYHSRRIASDA